MSTMNTSAPVDAESANDRNPSPDTVRERIERFYEHPLTTPVQATGFWLAATLPLVYVPLAATGFSSTVQVDLVAALLVVNALALVVGHQYNRS